MTGRQIILATSAQRPEYARDFLTCLASPDGHRVAFSYQKGWFAENVLAIELVGRKAVIVFCDAANPRSEFEYLSVRQVEIEQLVPASLDRLRDSSPVTIVFQLGSLTRVTDAELSELRAGWNNSLRALDHRPRPKEHPDATKARFVFEHAALATSAQGPDDKECWRVLSEELGGCSSLKNAFFFRVGVLRQAGGGSESKDLTTKPIGSLGHVYSLDPSSEYELPLDAYSRSGKTPYSNAIAAKSSSQQLTVQAITQSSAGRASEAVLLLGAGEVKRAQIATLIIEGAEGFEHAVPRVELATRIAPKLWLAGVLMAIIALGVVAGGLQKDALGLSEGLLYVVKVLGGLTVGGATLFALGRVPGVGR